MASISNNYDIYRVTSPVQTGEKVTPANLNPENNIPVVDKQRLDICKKLNITPAILDQILAYDPEFLEKDFDLQAEIAKQYTPKKEPQQAEQTITETQTSNKDFNHKEYNLMGPLEKYNILKSEFVKNAFIYGIKNKDGNFIQGFMPHSAEEWEKLSEADKKSYISNLQSLAQKDSRLSAVLNDFEEKIQGSTQNAQTANKNEGLLDATMRALQAANSKNLSFSEFMLKDEGEKLDIITEYLDNLPQDEKSDSDIKSQKYTSLRHNTIVDLLNSEYNLSIPKDITFSELSQYMHDYNIGTSDDIYHSLKDIPESELSDYQSSLQTRMRDLLGSAAGQDIANKSKGANHIALQNEYNTLQQKIQAGEPLTQQENQKLARLQDYLNSDRAKKYSEYAEKLPRPSNEYELSVYRDIEDFNKQTSGYLQETQLKTLGLIKFIDTKTKGMSEADKEKYIETFLKYNNDISSVELLARYGKKYPNLYKKDYLISEQAVTIANGEATEQNINAHLALTTEMAKKPDNSELVLNSISTVANSEKIGDGTRVQLSETAVNTAQYLGDGVIQLAQDSNRKIKDEKLQRKSLSTIQRSPYYSTNCRKHDIDHLGGYHENNRLHVLDGATANNSEATAYAATSGAVTKLGKDDQTTGFTLVNERINEYFEDEDAIKYSNALSDQIQYCDKDNQLAMHNEIMTSQYTEVQEHAAGNIKYYDPSVQADAINTVYATGNQNAIEAAIVNLAEGNYANGVQEQVLGNTLNTAFNPENSEKIEELRQKIVSGETLSPQEWNFLTPQEKSEYQAAYFKALTPAKQLKLLANISDPSLKKSIYKKLANQDKQMLKNLIASDADTAKFIYDMGIANEMVIGICEQKASSEIKFATLLNNIKHSEDFVLKDYPPTAKTIGYASIPFTTQEKFDIFKKDTDGHLLA